jgi:outer membrane protein assembly factor BamB
VLWTSEPGPISTGILALGDEIVLADAAGVLRRFEQASGKLRGSIALGHAFKGPPVSLGAGRLLVSGDRAIACVDLRAGRVVWKREMRISSSRPYVRGGAVLAATPQGELIAFRVADGLPLWTRSFQGTIHGIGYDDRTLYIGTEEGMVHAYRRGMAR